MRLPLRLLQTFLCVGLLLANYQLAKARSETSKEVVIKFHADIQKGPIDSLTAALGLVKIKSMSEINVAVFRISSDYSMEKVVQICSKSPYVEYAEPTARFRVAAIGLQAAEPATAAEAQQSSKQQAQVAEHKEGELLIKFKSDVAQLAVTSLLNNVGITIDRRFDEIGVYKCSIKSGKSVLKATEECNADSNVEYAEPNYIYHASVEPNDPRFPDMFGLDKIDAPQAWDKQKGAKSIVVGVIDTGADHEHEDLKANMWRNTGEIGNGKENNGIDDDGNGFVDDFQGWDFVQRDNDPFDDNEHGTHVSGTIGAVGNNGTGVVGVNWTVSIMPLKFLNAQGSGTTDDAIDAILYGVNMGANVLSNSWGGGGFSRALEDAIKFANQHGVLFVAAAGNASSNNDSFPTFPANYAIDNVIAVASSTSSDNLSGFSNFGKKTVHLAAPGSNILSTLPRNKYGLLSGTSMATPHVSGAAALVWAQFPNATMKQIKARIVGSVDRLPNFTDKVISGGRLNVNKALSTNPIIANTTRLENTLDETGPYIVESDIVDDGSIQTATLTYQVMGQQAVTVAMTALGSDSYRGEIPGQALGSTITYFVTASDGDGNQAQDRSFSFSIAEPTNGGGCCGKPAIDLAFENATLHTTANVLANISFFILPFVGYQVHSKRRKKNKNRK
ncbi:MAG: S8 family peptidase [bacterium]